MSNKFEVENTFALLDKLKTVVRDFASREQRVDQDLNTKVARERHAHELALEELSTQLSTDLANAETAYAAAREDAEAKYDFRKTRISRAHRASKDQAMSRIENTTGSAKYALQKKLMQLERQHDDGLDANEKRFEEFKNDLLIEQQSLENLEQAARKTFRGYYGFAGRISRAYETSKADPTADEYQLLAELRKLLAKAEADLKRFRWFPLPFLFRFLPVWLLIIACAAPALLQRFGIIKLTQNEAMGYSIGGFVGVVVLYIVGRLHSAGLAGTIANGLGKSRRLHDTSLEKSEIHYSDDSQRIEATFVQNRTVVDGEYKKTVKEDERFKVSQQMDIDQRKINASAKSMALHRGKLERLEQQHVQNLERLKQESESRRRNLTERLAERETQFKAENQTHWQNVATEWKSKIQPIYESAETLKKTAEELFPSWNESSLERWAPPSEFIQATEFGKMEVDVETFCEGIPKDKRLTLPGPARFALPVSLTFPKNGSILFETSDSGRDDIVGALNNIVLRLLTTIPPGKVDFTIIDPVGLGKNFSGLMHLADYEERLINSRIWTQSGQIEEKLGELNEHMEKIIQMYLRNEYETIADYNRQAGNMAEKYHFLVIADFPVNFSETAIKRLLSIAASGARCGVYTLIHWDQRQAAPQDFVPAELRKNSITVSKRGNEFVLQGKSFLGTKLVLDTPPTPELATAYTHKIGRASKDSSRVEVPFNQVVPKDNEVWSEDTTSELRVPIGRTGATKFQYLAIGKGTRQHALIAGKTGSGKSTLFHVIITNLSLWCSPEQVEFYLIDFKKGVEFKCYGANRLPHARVVAIESDREFGLSVLQRVDDELKRRGDLFRKLGAQDIAGYKRAGGTEPMPRSLLMIDEFQEFFVEEDRISQNASVLLDRIVRQGRAFGIHVILGSQTLGGAYTVARTTLGQMVIRIALQCNEADAYLIMDDSNPAPRLLTRPGEGIYNDAAGALEGNSPFQAVWLSDDERDDYLSKVRERADHDSVKYPGPIVFEGNTPADVQDNLLLKEMLHAESIRPTMAPRMWLGAPNAIKGPTEAVFERQSGNNLLVVGQREEAALSIVAVGLISLAAQYAPGKARLIIFDGNPPGSTQREFLERIVAAVPHNVTLAKATELNAVMNDLAADLKKRTEEESAVEAPETFLFLHGLQKFNKLRYEDEFSFSSSEETTANPSVQLNNLVAEGGSVGFHVIATCDTLNNVNRFFNRKALTGFEMRVLFQMSANDSASLIDSPKASTLGLHRAIFYNEQQGYLEVFRPYALPEGAWIEEAARNLSRLQK